MSFHDDWQRDKMAKKAERDARKFARRMLSPVARGEVFQLGEVQLQHLASLALAVEALEDILVGRGLLAPDELMDCMKLMAEQKREIAEAAAAAESQSSLIASV